MRYLSVCSGIEAATCAWHPLGWEPVGFSEIEAFPSSVLAHHYPNVPNLGDMTKFKEWPDATFDVLVGGTPCQSFSVAGLRKGLADPRGNHALVYLALADRYRPEWLVWENVPGVLSSGGGRDFGSFLGALVELGYGFAYRVLDAQFFGVAQRRRRVFVVANARDWRRAAAVLFERESLSGHPAPRRESRPETTVGTLGGTSAGAGWRFGADEAAAGQLITGALRASSGGSDDNHARANHLIPDVAGTINSSGRAAGSATQQDAHAGMLLAFGGNNTAGPIDVATAVNASGSASGRQDFESETFIAVGCKDSDPSRSVSEGISPTLRAMGHSGSHANAGGQVAIAISGRARGDDGRGYQRPEHLSVELAGTVDTVKPDTVQTGMAVRRLTPRECERLQGFSDDYTRIPWRTYQEAKRKGVSYESLLAGRGMKLREPAGEECPDGPRYKALGNTMAVPVMHWIGTRIDAVSRAELRAAA